MTLSSSFRLSLNKITVAQPLKSKIYNLLGNLQFNLVVLEETNYINFQLVNNNYSNNEFLEPIEDFVKLITKPEYVSLTYNTFYMDHFNRKIIFKPRILPGYSYEFDFLDSNMEILKRELSNSMNSLGGFLKLKMIGLDPIDYDYNYENGNYHSAIDYSSDIDTY
ncbi:hypothetical protein BN7_6670 [Wickerhamomyces ciferrii]|uniref:Uncharacterized protein n=1 Tax=Wickerhamomyces ciferrii (strain ATCC 14091 / BCRC 22168 / CBS 111 / JCM 3599 / NBRC 0793 / NRRL Y-1031 F-60-10) TaxID=1206466 RepID=K0KUZ5_WICCF|nr:uncharacterized protein BN7_6670 [Wickerhamomyces ciferrii]CCH47061.1 hypothetical protein BN7_6670 [Wickerhamomyces ciferrii]